MDAFVPAPVSVTVVPMQTEVEESIALTAVGGAVHPGSTVTTALSPVIIAKQPAAERALSML